MDIGISGYTLSSSATARAVYYSSGHEVISCEHLSGQHLITSDAGTITESTPFRIDSRTYSGTIYSSSEAGACYQARIDATTESTGINQGAGSSSRCRPSGSGGQAISQLCPLLLDLNGNGIATTGLTNPVRFWDYDGDGINDPSGWTGAGGDDAFVWIDLDDNHRVAQNELFGSAMTAPGGEYYRNGFQALAAYDLPENGGNGDNRIDHSDTVWGRLRLWVDADHDAVSRPTEISPLPRHAIVSLGLTRVHDHSVDPAGNSLMLVGSCLQRQHGTGTVERPLVDIAFAF
ncbi:MAG TPA: hypothetical protein VEK57_20990 [Thermoanaerobaculia bacterium]|nr:hypothetical protein [Thermoanaerobaculia bacterium]